MEDKLKYSLNAKEYANFKEMEGKFSQIEQWVIELRQLILKLSGYEQLV